MENTSVYRHLTDREIRRAYRKALRVYDELREDAFYHLADRYLAEARELANELDRRASNG